VGAFYYLVNYGYISKDESKETAALMSDQVITKAVKDFQVFAGLEPTGDLDDETVELMNTPRCGVKDNVGPSDNARRKKRYALQGSRWKVDILTWRVSRYPTSGRLAKYEIDDQLKKAFQIWADKTNLKFEKKDSGTVHIDIRFETKEHGDGDPFDGPGGTLAHAFFPQYGGDAHFDNDEYWTINEFKGTNLFQTAAHEFGHSLGLSHSDVRSALMAPFYKGWDPSLELDRDDVDAIQALYGEKDTETDPDDEDVPINKPDIPGSNANVDLCSDPSFDTIFGTADGSYYVFKGSKYWKLTEDSVEEDYPRNIRDDWPGLPDSIDAALTWTDNQKTYFFKGDQYWKFDNQEPISGYPKQISDGFQGIPNDLDAAFVWGGNGKIYFFKGDQYWKFDTTRKPPVPNGYPRSISNWDLPANIDGAVKWSNKRTYFFRNGEYYRFNDRRFAMDQGEPAYPRPIGPWWFGCDSNDQVEDNSGRAGEDNPLFSLNNDGTLTILLLKSLRKEDSVISLAFDAEGDELLDVIATDE